MPSDYALITLPELKTFPNLSSVAESEDAILEALIDAATADLEDHWQTYGVQRSVTERVKHDIIERSSKDGNVIWLDKFPVVSITSITDPAGNVIASTDYWIDYEQGALRTTGCWDIPQDANTFASYWTIVYVAGWVANTAAVPANIKNACKMHVASLYKRPDKDVISKSVGDLSITYRNSENVSGVSDSIKRLISKWKKMDV